MSVSPPPPSCSCIKVCHGIRQYSFDPSAKIGSSQLHAATLITTDGSKPVSIKRISRAKCPEFLHLEGLVHHILAARPHPSLPAFIECFDDEEGNGYVVQRSYDRDLHSHIRVNGKFSEDAARPLFRQIVSAVAHSHSLNVVLRDIKLGKILFTDSTRTNVVLADIDGAQKVDPFDSYLFDQKGSPAYVSPEVLTCQPYDGSAADMWTLGVILYVMLTGAYPFQDRRPATLFQKIQQGSAGLTFPDHLSPQAQSLIKKLLSKQPSQRPKAADVLQSPWMDRRPRDTPACLLSLAEPDQLDIHESDHVVPGAAAKRAHRFRKVSRVRPYSVSAARIQA